MVVEYDYSEAYNAGSSYASKLNRMGFGMVDNTVVPPTPQPDPSPTPAPGPAPTPQPSDPDANKNTDPPGDSSNPINLVIPIAGGIVVLIIILVCCCRKKK